MPCLTIGVDFYVKKLCECCGKPIHGIGGSVCGGEGPDGEEIARYLANLSDHGPAGKGGFLHVLLARDREGFEGFTFEVLAGPGGVTKALAASPVRLPGCGHVSPEEASGHPGLPLAEKLADLIIANDLHVQEFFA